MKHYKLDERMSFLTNWL